MRYIERIRTLLSEVGAILNVFVIDEYEDESFWHIALDAESILFAEVDHERGLMVLSADAGSPASDKKIELYELLLNYNHHINSTAGTHLSLDAPGGAVWLWSEMAVERLDRDVLARWLDDYRRKLVAWRKIVAEASRTRREDEGTLPYFETNFLIRG